MRQSKFLLCAFIHLIRHFIEILSLKYIHVFGFFFMSANPLGILVANVIVPAMVTSCDGHDIPGAVSLY